MDRSFVFDRKGNIITMGGRASMRIACGEMIQGKIHVISLDTITIITDSGQLFGMPSTEVEMIDLEKTSIATLPEE